MYAKKSMLYQGKAKSMYETDDPEVLIADFRDDTTAFNGVKLEQLSEKGSVNSRISTFIMQHLAAHEVPTHFIEQISDHEVAVRRLTMLPVECVVRNIAAGGVCNRLGVKAGLKLDPPLFVLFYKSDDLNDPMINDNHAVTFGWATREQLDEMKRLSLEINSLLQALFLEAGLIFVDAKYEFGIDNSGKIYLADEISPDSCRIWDVETGEVLDKDRFRKDMGNVVESYKVIAERLGV